MTIPTPYFKQKGKAGWPATEETADAEYAVPDYNYISQNVGLPDRDNCASAILWWRWKQCNTRLEKHVYGDRELDVHMD